MANNDDDNENTLWAMLRHIIQQLQPEWDEYSRYGVGRNMYYRMLGDALQLMAMLLICYRLLWKRSAVGISLKTQKMFFLSSCTHLVSYWVPYHFFGRAPCCVDVDSVFRCAYIILATVILWAFLWGPARSTYVASEDPFPHVAGLMHLCFTIAALLNALPIETRWWSCGGWWWREKTHLKNLVAIILYTFRILLETVAMLPQLLVFHRNRRWLAPTVQLAIACMCLSQLTATLLWKTRPDLTCARWWGVILGIFQFLCYTEFWYGFLRNVYDELRRRCCTSHGHHEKAPFSSKDTPNTNNEDEEQVLVGGADNNKPKKCEWESPL